MTRRELEHAIGGACDVASDEELIDAERLVDRIALLPVEEEVRGRLVEWVRATARR